MFSDFLTEMKINFNSDSKDIPGSFWNKMFALGKAISMVWESGMSGLSITYSFYTVRPHRTML